MLAIDPSLTSLGYAYRQRGRVVTGTFAPKGIRGPERLAWVEEKVAGIVRMVEPEYVVYEDYSMGSRGKVFHIGELGGVLKLYLWRVGIGMIMVPPSSLKLFVTGKGNADKSTMMRVLAQHRGRSFVNSDEADAYGLLIAGEAFCNRKLLPRTRGNPQQQAITGFEVVPGR